MEAVSIKHVHTYPAESDRPARWVITFEPSPRKRGRWFEVNVTQDITTPELEELFVETQATIADRQAALAEEARAATADTDPAGPPPVKE